MARQLLWLVDVMAYLVVAVLLWKVFWQVDIEGQRDVWSIGAILLIFGFFLLYRVLLHRWNQQLSTLEKLADSADGDLAEALADTLPDAWRQFQRTLVGNRRTASADVFFHATNSLLPVRFSPGWFLPTGPQVLLSLGILGTFVGLFLGLMQSLPDIEKAMGGGMNEALGPALQDGLKDAAGSGTQGGARIGDALHALLLGAQLAFSKSIAGLVLSLAYSWRFRQQEHCLVQALGALAREIDEMFDPYVPEQDFVALLTLQKRAEEDRKDLVDHLSRLLEFIPTWGSQLTSTVVDEGRLQREALRELGAAFQAEAGVIHGLLRNELLPDVRQLRLMPALHKTVLQIQEQHGRSAGIVEAYLQALQALQQRVVEHLHHLGPQVEETLEKILELVNQININLGQLSEILADSQQPKLESLLLPILHKAMDPLVQAQQNIGAGLVAGAGEAISKSAGGELEKLRASLEAMLKVLEGAPKLYSEGIEKAGSSFEAHAQAAAGHLVFPVEKIQGAVDDIANSLRATKEIADTLEKAGGSVRDVLVGTVTPLQSVQKGFRQTAEQLSLTVDAIKAEREALVALHTATTSLTTTQATTVADLEKLLVHLQSTAGLLAAFDAPLQALSGALSSLPATLGTHLQEAGERFTAQTELAGQKLSFPMQEIQAAVAAVQVSLQVIQQIAVTLQETGSSVQGALQGTATPLLQVTGHLNAAAATLGQHRLALDSLTSSLQAADVTLQAHHRSQDELLRELSNLLQTTRDLNPEVRLLLEGVLQGRAAEQEAMGQIRAALEMFQRLIPELTLLLKNQLSEVGVQQNQASAESVRLLLEAAQNFKDAMEKIRVHLETATGTLFAEATQKAIEAASAVSGALSKGSETFAVTMDLVAKRMEDTSQKLEDGATITLDGLRAAAGVADGLLQTAEGMKAASKVIAEVLGAAGRDLRNNLVEGATELKEGMIDAAGALKEGLTEAAVPLAEATTHLRQVSNALVPVPAAIDAARQALLTEHQALVGWGNQLKVHVTEQSRLLQQMAEQAAKQLEKQGTESAKLLAEQHRVLGDSLKKQVADLGELLAGHEKLLHQLRNTLPSLLKQLTDTNDVLRKQYEQSFLVIQGSLDKFTKELANYAQRVESSLKLPGQLRDLNSHLERVAEGLDGMQDCCKGMKTTLEVANTALAVLSGGKS